MTVESLNQDKPREVITEDWSLPQEGPSVGKPSTITGQEWNIDDHFIEDTNEEAKQ